MRSIVATVAIAILALGGANSPPARASDAGVAYCAVFAREAVRIDLMHTIPVSPQDVSNDYIEALAVQVFKQCVSVLPTLLPLPEKHRNLGSWIGDMRYMLEQRIEGAGTAPAADRPQASIASDEAWRQQCAATYRSWDEETGTVVRRGSHERVRCPCGDGVDCP